MNCKFHPGNESVVKCATCGVDMCDVCDKNAYYYTENEEAICLECSLKAAEKELVDKEEDLKVEKKQGLIASIIWIVGVCLLPLGGFGILVMLGAAIFFFKSALLFSEENDFFEKIKQVLWNIVLITLLCPFGVLFLILGDKRDIKRLMKKIESIKKSLSLTE